MILGKDKEDKIRIFKNVAKLYDARCNATHGKKFAKIDYSKVPTEENVNEDVLNNIGSMIESYELLEDLLWEMIHIERLYSVEELKKFEKEFIFQFPELFSQKNP